MDNQIDLTYFFGLIKLPYINIESELNTPSDVSVSIELERLNRSIVEYQEELLTKLFGSNIIPENVVSLVVNNDTKKSIIADYLFCNVVSEFQGDTTMSGEKIYSNAESQTASYMERYLSVWNRMVKQCIKIRKILYDAGEHSTYPTDDDADIYNYKSFV